MSPCAYRGVPSTRTSQAHGGFLFGGGGVGINMRFQPNTPDDFWAKVRKAEPDECWLWTTAIGAGGYGKFCMLRKNWLSHRMAYTLTHGPIPLGLLVRHTCDTPPCCNPAHLVLGSQADNVADRVVRGRSASGDRAGLRLHPESRIKGERHPRAILREDDVRFIREAARAKLLTRTQLAHRYGVKTVTIDRAISRHSWAHID